MRKSFTVVVDVTDREGTELIFDEIALEFMRQGMAAEDIAELICQQGIRVFEEIESGDLAVA